MKPGSFWAYHEAGAFDCDPDDLRPDIKVLSTGEHTARKAQGCQCCGGQIAPGQRYKKAVMLYEGAFQIDKSHADHDECAASRKAVEESESQDLDAFYAHHSAMEEQAGERLPL